MFLKTNNTEIDVLSISNAVVFVASYYLIYKKNPNLYFLNMMPSRVTICIKA